MTVQEIVEKAKKRLPTSFRGDVIQIPIDTEDVVINPDTASMPSKNTMVVVIFKKEWYSNQTYLWRFYRIDR
jgi:hypothetical protein